MMEEEVAKWRDQQPQQKLPESSPSSKIHDVTKQSIVKVGPKPVTKTLSYDARVMKPVELPPPTTRKTAQSSEAGLVGRKWTDLTTEEKKLLELPSNQQLRKLFQE